MDDNQKEQRRKRVEEIKKNYKLPDTADVARILERLFQGESVAVQTLEVLQGGGKKKEDSPRSKDFLKLVCTVMTIGYLSGCAAPLLLGIKEYHSGDTTVRFITGADFNVGMSGTDSLDNRKSIYPTDARATNNPKY